MTSQKSTSKKGKEIFFTDQVFSIGMDVHKHQWTITIVTDGVKLKTFTIEPDVDKLLNNLNRNYPGGTFKFVYEAGFCGFWIQRAFSARGYYCIVINAADIPTTQKDKVNKNDTVDSRKLAFKFDSRNSLKAIHVPSVEEEAFRDLYRYRFNLMKSLTATKHRIKAFLLKYGIPIAAEFKNEKWSKKLIVWLKAVDSIHKYSRIAYLSYIEDLESTEAKIKRTNKTIQSIIDSNERLREIYNIIKSAPGLGPICTYAFIAEIWDIKRFKTFDKLSNYIGLIPMTKNTDKKVISKGITFRHKKKLRCMLIEASWIAITKDPIMLQRFLELKKRMKANKAIIRIAKKLLRKIYYIWKKNESYVLAVA